jgi:hypothetical protein
MFQVKSAGNNVRVHKPPGPRSQTNACWRWRLLCSLAPNKRCDLLSDSSKQVLNWWKSIRKWLPDMSRHVSVKRKSTSGYRNIRIRYKWLKISTPNNCRRYILTWRLLKGLLLSIFAFLRTFLERFCLMIIATAEIRSNVMYKMDVFTLSHFLYLTAVVVPVDFGQPIEMYLPKINIPFRILRSTVYMQLGAAVNEIYGKKLKTLKPLT